MKIAGTHRHDDTYIEKAWKHAETEEIENLAAELLRKAQEAPPSFLLQSRWAPFT